MLNHHISRLLLFGVGSHSYYASSFIVVSVSLRAVIVWDNGKYTLDCLNVNELIIFVS